MLRNPLWRKRQSLIHYSSVESTTPTYILGDTKVFQVWVEPRSGKCSEAGQAGLQMVLLFEPHNPSEPMVDIMWSFWQAPIRESQSRSLGFQSKTMTSAAENYTSFEKEPLAMVEMECLTVRHQPHGQNSPGLSDLPSQVGPASVCQDGNGTFKIRHK